MTQIQKFITVPNHVAKTTEIGDDFKVDGKEYQVKSIHRDEEGSQIELYRDDEAQTTVNLDLEEESGLSLGSNAEPTDKPPKH